MRRLLITCLLPCLCGALTAQSVAENRTNAPSAERIGTATNYDLGLSNMTFTNRTGDTFALTELVSRLKGLQNSVEQTLPMLSAVNGTLSNSASSSGVVGAISSIFNRKGENGSNGSQNLTNVLSVIQGLFSTNSTQPTVSVPQNTLDGLAALQTQLEALPPIFQNLQLGSTNQVAGQNRSNTLPPTGRPAGTNR